MGMSLPDAQSGVSSTIFEDRIENLCASGGLDLAVVLGHVIAHELGHVLLESSEHARTGIMQAYWHKKDFDQAAMGLLRFSEPQGAAIRNHGAMREPSFSGWTCGKSEILGPRGSQLLNPGLLSKTRFLVVTPSRQESMLKQPSRFRI
jgi:hypothetical protein